MPHNVSAKGWPIGQLLSALEDLYKSAHLGGAWQGERARLKSRLDGLAKRLSSRYDDPTAIGLGGSGVVLRLADSQLAGQPVALKFPRPVPDQMDLLSRLLRDEIGHLVTLHHSSIVRIHGASTAVDIEPPLTPFPYYIMDFVEGDTSMAHFERTRTSRQQFIHIIEQVFDAIAYLHSKGAAHLDIKPANVLIDSQGTAVIADLGTAKLLTALFPPDTVVACTQNFADPDLLRRLATHPSDPNRNRGTIRRAEIDLRWDLYALGWSLLHWLGFEFVEQPAARAIDLEPYDRKYLLLMSARLLRGRVPQWLERKVGLPGSVYSEIAYESSAAALNDVQKLSGRFALVEAVPELNAYHPATVQVASESPTTYSQRLSTLVDHPLLRRLASITQLGLVSLVYPTATHSRLEHSLGTYHNTCRFILSMYYDPLSPLFRQIVTTADLRALLVASLLHDLGQFPLAHDLEEIDDKWFDHVPLTLALLGASTPTLPSPVVPLTDTDLDAWSVPGERVREILEAVPHRLDRPFKDRLLHSIIDGPMDADKLDYLRRDSDRLKVPYGHGIDVERILRSLTSIVVRHADGVFAFAGVHEKAKVPAEFISMARYALFAQAYWHHTVRAMKAMVARSVYRLADTAARRGLAWRRDFQERFTRFALCLPDSLYALENRRADHEAVQVEDTSTHAAMVGSTIAAGDAGVLHFLEGELNALNAGEAELLSDLLNRKLYKRWFVFSAERSRREWSVLLDKWTTASASVRLWIYEDLERQLGRWVTGYGGPATAVFNATTVERLAARVKASLPLILIDIPKSRPGAQEPLYFVVEGQRRALRKDDRAVGDAEPSSVWKEFSDGLREKAGKIRVFCHCEYVDLFEALVNREKFLSMFEGAVDYALEMQAKNERGASV